MPCGMQGEWGAGKHGVIQEAEGKAECGQESLLWFLWEGTGKAGHTGLVCIS